MSKLPAVTDVTVIPADPKDRPTIGFVVREYQGTIVAKPASPEEPLTGENDIQPGDQLVVTTLMGPLLMEAYRDDYGVLFAKTDRLIADLKFDTDDRHCWVSTYAINRAAIKQLTITGK